MCKYSRQFSIYKLLWIDPLGISDGYKKLCYNELLCQLGLNIMYKIDFEQACPTDMNHFSDSETLLALQQIEAYVNTAAAEEIQKSSCLNWLIDILTKALSNKNTEIYSKCEAIVLALANRDFAVLAKLFTQPLPESNEPNLLYKWFHAFYSLTFNDENINFIHQMVEMLSQLLHHPDASLLADGFINPIKEGDGRSGKNALIIASQALLQATIEPWSEKYTSLMAQFIANIFTVSPAQMNLAAITPIQNGALEGKTVVYFLASSLKDAAKFNQQSEAVSLICSILSGIGRSYPNELTGIVATEIAKGPYHGHLLLHITLLALIHAAYVDGNTKGVANIANFLQLLVDNGKNNDLYLAFQAPILYGVNANLTGVKLLDRAIELCKYSKIPSEMLNDIQNKILFLKPDNMNETTLPLQ